MKSLLTLVAAAVFATAAGAQTAPAPLQPLPGLEVAPYMGTWYQVLWIPTAFRSSSSPTRQAASAPAKRSA